MVLSKEVKKVIDIYKRIVDKNWNDCDIFHYSVKFSDVIITVTDSYIERINEAFHLIHNERYSQHFFLINFRLTESNHLKNHSICLWHNAETLTIIDPQYPTIQNELQSMTNFERYLKTHYADTFTFMTGDYIYGGYQKVSEDETMMWEKYYQEHLERVELKTTPPQIAENLYLQRDNKVDAYGDCKLWCYIIADCLVTSKKIPSTGIEAYQTATQYINKLDECFN